MSSIVVSAGLAFAACSTMKVSSMSSPGEAQRAATYRTYAWLPHPATPDPNHNPIVGEIVQQAADRELAKKGYQRVDESAGPDFLVGWHASSREATQVQTFDAYYGYGWGWGAAVPETYVSTYKEGSLIIDVVDRATNKLAWRGWAEADLSFNPGGETPRQRIEEATSKIFEKFPPKS
jgi:hypothetical protein